MTNNKEIAEQLEQIQRVVTSYIHQNMNQDFQFDMYSQKGSHATFTTEAGAKVDFTSYRDFIERYLFVEIEGQTNQKPFQFNFQSSMSDYGTGTVYCGNYGIAFWNVGDDEKEPTIKPFKKILGIKSYKLGKKALNEILPLLDQLSTDIKTITPDEETKQSLKQTETKKEVESQEVSQQDITGATNGIVQESIASKKEDLEKLKDQLLQSSTESLDQEEKAPVK